MHNEIPLVLVDADSVYFKAACKAQTKIHVKKNIDSLMLEIEGQLFGW